MKKRILYALLCCFSFLGTTMCQAQSNDNQLAKECAKESKMKYVHSMEEAQKLAYQKKKPIFFNCYAEWAGPCMAMDRFVFSNQEFADYMDKNFINLIIDMRSAEGKKLAKEYNVKSYATFFVLDYKGNIIQRISSGGMLPAFKDKVAIALSKKTSLAGSREKYESGKYGKKDVFNYLNALNVAGEDSLFRKIGKEYMAMINEKEYSDAKHTLLLRLNKDRNGSFFRYLVKNKPLFIKSMGEKTIDGYIASLFSSEILSFATGDAAYDATKMESLLKEMDEAQLPDTNLVRTVYQIGKLRGERRFHDLLVFMEQSDRAFQQQPVVRPIIETSFKFEGINDEEKKELIAYLDKASKREKGTYARRLKSLIIQIQAGEKGIQFEHDSFQNLLAKAAKENKLIFLDCYTSWCGPCRMMANNVFTKPNVGEFFNKHFINVKIDMEKGEGKELAKKYQVRAFPTLLFIDKNGNVVERTMGAKSPQVLLEIAQEVLKK